MKCSDLMKRDVAFVTSTDNAHTAARRMRDLDIGFLPVCDQERRPIGAITDRDICIRVCADDHRASNVSVREAMTPEHVACKPNDDLSVAEKLMKDNRKSRVMIVSDDGALMGVISLSDIADAERGGAADTLHEVSQRELR